MTVTNLQYSVSGNMILMRIQTEVNLPFNGGVEITFEKERMNLQQLNGEDMSLNLYSN